MLREIYNQCRASLSSEDLEYVDPENPIIDYTMFRYMAKKLIAHDKFRGGTVKIEQVHLGLTEDRRTATKEAEKVMQEKQK